MQLEKIQTIMKNLPNCDNRPIFHSERDFVFAFAWSLHKNFNLDIRMETKPYRDKKLFFDIWCPQLKTAIEVKYKTKPIELIHSDEYFKLGDHPTDLGRHDFIKDIERLEALMGNNIAETGFAIILSNDHLYWEPWESAKNSIFDRSTNSDAFRIHESCILHANTEMSWRDGSAELKKNGERSDSIILKRSYELNSDFLTSTNLTCLILPVYEARFHRKG